MDLNRPCTQRRSKKSPNSYTKDELITLATEDLGISKSEAKKMTKVELCAQLIEKTRTGIKPVLVSDERVCSPRRRREFPNRYSKDDLIEKAYSELNIPRGTSRQMGYGDLCQALDIDIKILEPRVKRSKSKSPKRIEEINVAEIVIKDENCVTRSKLPLKAHQKRVIEVFNKRRGLIAIHSTGSGKTLTAVTASQCFLDDNPSKRVIVVTPTSLQGNFKKEMRDYGADLDDPRYVFYTFKGFSNAIDAKEINCKGALLIVDEAHNLRTEIKGEGGKAGKTSQNVINCAKKAAKVLLLTATPIVNRPYDLANLIAMVDGEDQLSKHFFNKMLEDPDQMYNYFVCKVSMFSPKPEDVKADYPESENHEVFIPMTKKYYKLYKDLEKSEQENNLLIDLFGDVDLQVFYNGVRRGSNNLEAESSPKVTWIMNKIDSSKKAEKFVIFSHFLEAGLKLLMKEFQRKGISFKHIDGSMAKSKREEIVKEYNSNKIKVLLISKAGGEGLDLKETRNIIIMEPSWNEATHKQVIGRAIRYKSHETLPREKRKVDVYRLYLIKPNEDSELERLLTDKSLLFGEGDDAETLAVDLYLRNFVMLKQEKIDEFLESLRELTIEKNKC